jgi:hypothetical protein
MKRFIFGLLLLGLPVLIFAQVQSTVAAANVVAPPSQALPLLSVQLAPGLNIPMGESSPVFGLGGSVLFGVEFRLPSLPLVYISGGLRYDYDAANYIPQSISVASASLGSGLRFDLLPWLSATAGISGGYFFSFLNDFSKSGCNPLVSAEAGVILLRSPWHVNVGVAYLYYFGLYSGLSASIGLSYDFAPSKATKVAALVSQIAKAQDPRKPTSELGVLYAQYGQYDKAQKQFEKLLATEEYVPAWEER